MSGRRVQGREAIACDAVGALDAMAATGTLIKPRKIALPERFVMLPLSPPDHVSVLRMPGAPCRVGPLGPQPGASVAGRGGAQRSRLDLNTAKFGNAGPDRAAAVASVSTVSAGIRSAR